MKLMKEDLLRGFERECKNGMFGRAEFDDFSPEVKLVLCYAYYHYFNGDPRKVEDLKEGVQFYKPRSPHQIAGIFAAGEEDLEAQQENTIDILIPIFAQDEKSYTAKPYGEFLAQRAVACRELLREYRGLLNQGAMRDPIETRLRRLGFKGYGNSSCSIRLVFLTNMLPKANEREKIPDYLGRKEPIFRSVEKATLRLEYVYGDDIEYEVYNTASAYPYVTSGELLLDRPGNVCEYENSYVVNIMASSLRNLYGLSMNRGLLAQNLRFYVENEEVDNAIKRSATEMPDLFWYLNNGITIACEDCIVNGRTLSLKNFSIVNGGQTTHNIGVLSDDQLKKDFPICCKIIRGRPNTTSEEQEALLANVAVSSNSQKPIKKQDLIANREEHRSLKRDLANCKPDPIFYATKRGEALNKKAYPELWQATTPVEVLQMVLAFRMQHPGFARNQKAQSITKYHDGIFCGERPLSPLFIRDQLIIKRYLELLKAEVVKNKKIPEDPEVRIQNGLIRNGILPILAICGAIYSVYLSPATYEVYSSYYADDAVHGLFTKTMVNFALLKNYEKCEEPLLKFIQYCIVNYFVPAYKKYVEDQGQPIYSNFTKTDQNYIKFVLRLIAEAHKGKFPEELQQEGRP